MTVLTKIRKAKSACLREWFENYNYRGSKETLKMCQHDRVLPKIALVGMAILLVFALAAVI